MVLSILSKLSKIKISEMKTINILFSYKEKSIILVILPFT